MHVRLAQIQGGARSQRYLRRVASRSKPKVGRGQAGGLLRGEIFGINEDVCVPGDTPYGKSKWDAEQCVIQWAKKSKDRCAMILRSAVVYGPGNTANIYAMVNALARGRFFLVGHNHNVKSIVSLRNLTPAVVHLIPLMKPGVEIFNITDERSYSVRELASMIARLLEVKWTDRSLPIPLAKGIARFGDVFSKLTGKVFPLPRLDWKPCWKRAISHVKNYFPQAFGIHRLRRVGGNG